MEKKIVFDFDEEDIRLLETPIIQNPCRVCTSKVDCMGCPTFTEYRKIVEPYKERNILAYKLDIEEIRRLKDTIDKLNDTIVQIQYALPEECKKITKKIIDN